jgi:hypothetical protein
LKNNQETFMTRALTLAAAFAAVLALAPLTAAMAETQTTAPKIGNLFTEVQARQHLLHLGYTDVSPLEKDANGRWIGSATKDGKTVGVAVDIKGGPVVTN